MRRKSSIDRVAPMSVLLVEDSAPVRQRLRALIAETPSLHLVADAATVAEAKHHFDATHPETMVLDLGLPDGSGMDVLWHVREKGGQCAVIVLSNHLGPETCKCCRDLGADFIFSKANEFERAIETLCALSKRRKGAPRPLCHGRDSKGLAPRRPHPPVK